MQTAETSKIPDIDRLVSASSALIWRGPKIVQREPLYDARIAGTIPGTFPASESNLNQPTTSNQPRIGKSTAWHNSRCYPRPVQSTPRCERRRVKPTVVQYDGRYPSSSSHTRNARALVVLRAMPRTIHVTPNPTADFAEVSRGVGDHSPQLPEPHLSTMNPTGVPHL